MTTMLSVVLLISSNCMCSARTLVFNKLMFQCCIRTKINALITLANAKNVAVVVIKLASRTENRTFSTGFHTESRVVSLQRSMTVHDTIIEVLSSVQ